MSSAATPNYAIFAIPLYMVLAQLPHAYSVYLITSHNNYQWDNCSPRSASNKDHVAKTVPHNVLRRFERCRATHDNMLENMAFVVGGVLSGVVCKLDAEWMNLMCGILLGARVLYLAAYMNVSSQKLSPLRTVWYLVASLAVFGIYWKAGWTIVEHGQIP